MTPDATCAVTLDRPIDLSLSLSLLMNGSSDPTQRLDEGHYWKATRTPEGPATLHLARRPGCVVEAEAWGPGAAWLMPRVPGLVGAEDPPDALAAAGGLVHSLDRAHRGYRVTRAPWIHEILVQVILQQRVSSVQAFAGYRDLVRRHGEVAPGPAGLTLPVAPRQLAYLPGDVFMRAMVDHQRAETVRAASLVYRRVEETIDWPLGDVRARLSKIRGVGPWTLETTMMLAFGDPDAVPLGDFHLPHTVAWALAGEERGDDARMLELLAPYTGQRRRVIALIEAGGIHAPRYGPRLRLPGPPRWRRGDAGD